MPLGCPAVPGAEFSVAGFASGAFAMQPRNGPIPVLDGPQRARARAASDARIGSMLRGGCGGVVLRA